MENAENRWFWRVNPPPRKMPDFGRDLIPAKKERFEPCILAQKLGRFCLLKMLVQIYVFLCRTYGRILSFGSQNV